MLSINEPLREASEQKVQLQLTSNYIDHENGPNGSPNGTFGGGRRITKPGMS